MNLTADRLRLNPSLVLALLPPHVPRARESGLITLAEPDRPDYVGKVRAIGADVQDVQVGDFVLFGRLVGQPVDVDGAEHVLVPWTEIDAIINPETSA